MSDSIRAARGIVANTAALATGFLVSFVLAPLVVNSLGSVRFGIWVVIGVLLSYLGLLDLGMRTAVTTHVARYHASRDHDRASAAVSAAFWLRQWTVPLVLGGALLFGALLVPVFKVPPDLASEAYWALVLQAVALVVSLMGGVFAAVLHALNRLDLVATTTILQTVIRAVGTVVLLRRGYGLAALAALEVVAALAANAIIAVRTMRLYPELRVSLARPSRAILTELGRYSGELFVWGLFGRAVQAGPALIVGALLTPVAVAFYSIGGYLVNAVEQVRFTVTPTFIPLAARYHSTGNVRALRELLQRGTQLALVILMPILAALFTRGETFLRVWMGTDYSGPAGEVLRALSVGMAITSASATAGVIIVGLGRQREMLAWTGLHAVATVLLCGPLAPLAGIAGVAWGATAASLFGLIQARVCCRLVGVGFASYLAGSWGKPTLAVVPFALACHMTDRYWSTTSVLGYLCQIAAVFPIYLLSCAALMTADLKRNWSMLRQSNAADIIRDPVA